MEWHKILAYIIIIPLVVSCNNLANHQVEPLANKIDSIRDAYKNQKRVFIKGKGFVSIESIQGKPTEPPRIDFKGIPYATP